MSIRKRGKAWEIVIELGKDKEGKRHQHTVTFYGKAEDARKEEIKLKYEAKHGYYIGQGDLTVGKFLDAWLELGCQHLAYNTLKSYKEEIKLHIKPYLGDIFLEQLTPVHLAEYYKYKQTEAVISSTTINYHHRILRKAFNQSIPVRLHDNPCDSVMPPSKKKFRPTLLSAQDITKIFEMMQNDPRYISVILSIMTGMRRGETCGLHWNEINFENDLLKVDYCAKRQTGIGIVIEDTKNGKGRLVPITPFLKKELLKQKEKQEEWKKVFQGDNYNEENLIVTWHDGRPVDPNEVTKKYNKVLKKLGLNEKSRFHDLRHSHATLLFEGGAEAKDVSEELGHSTIVITNDIYINPNIDRRREQVNKLDLQFSPPEEKKPSEKYKVKRKLKS